MKTALDRATVNGAAVAMWFGMFCICRGSQQPDISRGSWIKPVQQQRGQLPAV